MIDLKIAIETLLDVSHPTLWEIYSRRETMRFLRKRGHDFSRRDLSRVLHTILKGPPRKNYKEMNKEDWNEVRDHAIRQHLFLLSESGVILPKYAQKEFDRIQEQLPWEPREDRSGEFPVFIRTSSGRQDETGSLVEFASMEVNDFIEWSITQEDKRWDCSGGWFLFCENEPEIALKLLQMSGDQNVWPLAPWYDALSYFQKNENDISLRHKSSTAQTLLRMPIENLEGIDLQAARWLEVTRSKLGKKLRRQLWGHIWEAAGRAVFEGELDYDQTLNHAGGILAAVLMDELVEYFPIAKLGKNPGFFVSLIPYFELIGGSNSPSAKLARIRLSANLLYLFRIDPEWAERTLIRRMNSGNPDLFEAGLWEGYLWSPRIHDDLLVSLKPAFFRILEDLDSISERVRENAVYLFIDISVPPERGVQSSEAQELLQDMPSHYLAEAALRLKNILSGAGNKAPVLWRETIAPWFGKAWPRHADAKSQDTSRNLAWMAIETKEAFPEAVDAIADHLLPSDWGSMLSYLTEAGHTIHFPKSSWKMIAHTIGDETQFDENELRNLLEIIREGSPEIANSANFQRIWARC